MRLRNKHFEVVKKIKKKPTSSLGPCEQYLLFVFYWVYLIIPEATDEFSKSMVMELMLALDMDVRDVLSTPCNSDYTPRYTTLLLVTPIIKMVVVGE